MIKKKIKLFYKFFIQQFFKILYGKIRISKIPSSLFAKQKVKNPIYKTFNKKSYYIYKITKARIFTDNNENVAIIKNNYILPKISFQQVNGNLTNINNNSVIKHGTHSFQKKIKGKIFNLCQGGSGNNYFHFIFDILPKIYLLKSELDLNSFDFFYLNEPKNWQIKILNELDIPKKKLLSSKKNKHILADEVYAVDPPWYNNGLVQYNLNKIPKWIVHCNRKQFLNENKKTYSKKIFLDRSSSHYNHCQIKNMTEIINFVSKKNFKIYRPENLSFKKQIYLFNNSSVIFGAHGASFTNIIFCKPGTNIIELIPSDHPNKMCERISRILNLKYFRIKTKVDNTDPNYPFKINLEKKHFNLINKILSI
jgi:hypothetical protein